MRLSDFEYELPPGRIAQVPADSRDAARLLVHSLGADATEHRRVRDLPALLRPGDLVILNDTRVLPARLFGRRRSGGRVQLLLLEPAAGPDLPRNAWTALANPARKLHPGETIDVGGGVLRARMLRRPAGPDGRPAKEWVLVLEDALAPAGEDAPVPELLERHGAMPLPPYVDRPGGGTEDERRLDRERYQTVFAAEPGAVAAPTAGLHFTPELLTRLREADVRTATVTLHVGAGTFLPVDAEEVERHRMHSERYVLPEETARELAAARERGGRVIAVGTTSVRVLESRADEEGRVEPGTGSTDLFLRPGSRFHVVDGLLTNFHLPRTTLLMLVCAFGGRERVLGLYGAALERDYRFFSYGDAMLLLP